MALTSDETMAIYLAIEAVADRQKYLQVDLATKKECFDAWIAEIATTAAVSSEKVEEFMGAYTPADFRSRAPDGMHRVARVQGHGGSGRDRALTDLGLAVPQRERKLDDWAKGYGAFLDTIGRRLRQNRKLRGPHRKLIEGLVERLALPFDEIAATIKKHGAAAADVLAQRLEQRDHERNVNGK